MDGGATRCQQISFLNWPNPASFVISFFFSHCKDKYSTNLTINDKSVDGMLGSWTRGSRLKGADESTELWWHLMPTNLIPSFMEPLFRPVLRLIYSTEIGKLLNDFIIAQPLSNTSVNFCEIWRFLLCNETLFGANFTAKIEQWFRLNDVTNAGLISVL